MAEKKYDASFLESQKIKKSPRKKAAKAAPKAPAKAVKKEVEPEEVIASLKVVVREAAGQDPKTVIEQRVSGRVIRRRRNSSSPAGSSSR